MTPESRFWSHFSKLIETQIKNKNADRFLTWEPVINTMFVRNENYIATEYEYLRNRPDWAARWETAIRENPVGRPQRYSADPTTSENLIHHVYHLAKFEEIIGVPVDALDFVYEFGGGYGSMCRLFHDLKFKGKYVIFDLPILSCLQRYYLRAIGLRVADGNEYSADADVACVHDVAALDKILSGAVRRSKSLFISTWAISETPIDYRPTVLKKPEHLRLLFDCLPRDISERQQSRLLFGVDEINGRYSLDGASHRSPAGPRLSIRAKVIGQRGGRRRCRRISAKTGRSSAS